MGESEMGDPPKLLIISCGLTMSVLPGLLNSTLIIAALFSLLFDGANTLPATSELFAASMVKLLARHRLVAALMLVEHLSEHQLYLR